MSGSNNINELVASNAIDVLDDTIDDAFMNNTLMNNTLMNNTSMNNTSMNNTSMNNTSMNNNIQNNLFNNSTGNGDIMNNTLMNNSNTDNFELMENGIPLDEFDNSNNIANTNSNSNLLLSPNRNVNNSSMVNNEVQFSDPATNLNNISNNLDNDLTNNSSNINQIMKDGLLETASNNSNVEKNMEDYFYLDSIKDNMNLDITNNLVNNSVNTTNVSNGKLPENGVKISDNFILEFPARMSDGRQFTDYKSNGFLNLHEEELNTTLEYRMYLQNNAEKIMDNNYNIVASINDCSDCPGYEIVDTKSLLTCNKETCIEELKNNSGMGFDIKYVAS